MSLPSDVDALVRARFAVRDSFQLPEGEAEFRVAYDEKSKANFVSLVRELASIGYTPSLVGTKEDATVFVRRKAVPKPVTSLIPVILLFLTLLSVVLLGLLEASSYSLYAPSVDPYLVVVIFVSSVVAILAAHELGHRYVSESQKTTPPTSYFIPGIPVLTYFLPNIATVSSQREPAVNRDSLFDLYVAGPIAALAVSIALYAVGEFAWVQSDVTLQATSGAYVNENVIQLAIDQVFGPFVRSIPQGYFRLSPVTDAAFVGFLLTFLNLLPVTQFDGGYALVSSFGGRMLSVGTYLSVALLILVDPVNYWVIAFAVLLVAPRKTNPQYLDEISDPARSRKYLFLLLLLVAFLCLPIPQNFASFPL